MRTLACLLILTSLLAAWGCGGTDTPGSNPAPGPGGPVVRSHSQVVDNILVTTIVSKDANVFQAEYNAGFEQGRLQRAGMLSARDDSWDNTYLTDPSHSYPRQLPPSGAELLQMQQILTRNYAYTLDYIRNSPDPTVARNLKRILFRLLGLYHGTQGPTPPALDLSGQWLPDLGYLTQAELTLGYETPTLSFMDVYFLNAYEDATYVISFPSAGANPRVRSKCSAFVKKTADDVLLTHNTWSGFLSQTMAVNLFVNDTFVTYNAIMPGVVASCTDFGYNNQGILFNETTHLVDNDQARTDALWMFWRAALAEQFAGSLDEFFQYLSLEASGTYMNGYMVVDAKTREIGLVEMSYKNFVFFRPDGQGGIQVVTRPEGISTAYDPELLQPDYILGINFPVSLQIREDLQSVDNRPARRRQFLAQIGGVNDVEAAKALITYTEPGNPLSIYGRWDLGYGETPRPKTVPDGSIDAKVISASMVDYVFGLQGEFDLNSPNHSFWMKFGTASVEGLPFIWSRSRWSGQTLRDVPDLLDGQYHLLDLPIR